MEVKLRDVKGLMIEQKSTPYRECTCDLNCTNGEWCDFCNYHPAEINFNEALTQQGSRAVTLNKEKGEEAIRIKITQLCTSLFEYHLSAHGITQLVLQEAIKRGKKEVMEAILADLPNLLEAGEE